MFARLLPLLLLTGLTLSAAEPAQRQIEIESKFVQISAATARKLGNFQGIDLLNAPLHGTDAAVFTAEETADLILTLNATRGVDVLSAPRVITRPGQQAQIEIVHEVMYPTEWEPKVAGVAWTPSAFEARNVGITLEVMPQLQADGTIDLQLAPQIVRLLGFYNPITGKVIASDKSARPKPLAGGQMYQPLFHSHKVATSVTVNPGATVVLAATLASDTRPFKSSPATAPRLLVLISARVVEVVTQP